jgi:PQQ-like domain
MLDGDLIAVDAKTGEEAWRRNLHAHLESLPMVVHGTLYIGADATDIVALRASDGKLRCRFNSPGAIKASPSYNDGRLSGRLLHTGRPRPDQALKEVAPPPQGERGRRGGGELGVCSG